MAKARSFGSTPTDRVFVRVQHIQGGRAITTQSYNIYGQKAVSVFALIEGTLIENYGENEEEETDEPEVEERPARAVVRRRKKTR